MLSSTFPLPLQGLVFCATIWLMTNGVAAMEIVDQEYDPTGNISVAAGLSGMSVPPTQKRAQTFIVGQSGTLSAVDVFLNAPSGAAFGTLRLEIRETTPGGLPVVDPFFLVQTTMPMSSISGTSEFHNFDLRQFQLPVSVGDELAIVLFVEEGGTSINWNGGAGNPYQLGGTFSEQPPNFSWFFGSNSNQFDYGFRTTVAVPEPSGLAIAGLVAFALGMPRTRRV